MSSLIQKIFPRSAETLNRGRSAANPNLEVFKFGLYSLFPLAFMLYFGDPEWYQHYVLPFRDSYSKPEFQENKPPRTQEDARKMLADFKAKRLGTQQVGDTASTSIATQRDTTSAGEPKLV